MKKSLIAITLLATLLSCTKEQTSPSSSSREISVSEFEALKQDIKELKEKVAALTPGEGQVVSVGEFEALKTQVESLTSGFFEVDGLRFDKNGTLISVPKLESKTQEKVGNNTLTVTRTYDTQGRVIEILRDYNTRSEFSGAPYFWEKTLYEYNGKKCKTTTQTSRYGLPAGTSYEEVITETTYW